MTEKWTKGMVLGDGRGGREKRRVRGANCCWQRGRGGRERGACRCRNLEKDKNGAAVRLRRAVVVVPHCRVCVEKESNVLLVLPSYLLCTL